MEIEQSFSFLQCMKVLVDCLNDFGQWFEYDTSSTEKPFSPYAKWFDQCELSGTQAFLIQSYSLSGYEWSPAMTYRWVGSGAFDDGCWPGQLDYWMVTLENYIISSTTSAPNPFYQGGMQGKKHPDHDEFEGTFLSNILGPYLQKAIITFIDAY